MAQTAAEKKAEVEKLAAEELETKKLEEKNRIKKVKKIVVTNGSGSNLHYLSSGVVLMYKEEITKLGHFIPSKAVINKEDMEAWLVDHKEMLKNASYKKRVKEEEVKVEITYEQ